MTTSAMILMLVEATDQIHVFHWQTQSYSEHKALGHLYDSMADLTDKMAEVAMGADSGPRPKLSDGIKLSDYTPGAPARYLETMAKELTGISGMGTDLLALRDELMAEVNRTRYLLTLDSSKQAPQKSQKPRPANSSGTDPVSSAAPRKQSNSAGPAPVPAEPPPMVTPEIAPPTSISSAAASSPGLPTGA